MINKLLVKFKETLTLEKSLFIQMQNIIRNLQVHEYIFRLLSMQSSKKAQEEIELFHITIDFFQFFCQDNHINQMWVLSHIKPLLELLLNKICVNKLLRSALALKKSQHELISPYIDLLFTFLSQNYSRNKGKKSTQNPFKFLGYEILITIKAILYNAKTNTIYPENQKKVLNSLLKNDFMLKFSKSLYYIENKNKLIDKIKGLDSIKNMKCLPLLYHLILIELLGHLALDFKLGVLKLQKILVYEQLKALLYDPLTPFLVKKPYLRVLFSVYFIFLEEEYTSASMDDLKAFLTQILKDLNSSFSFLEYLIKPNKNGELTLEQKQARQEILTNKNYYMENLEEKERQQIQHNKKAMANTGMSTGINEQKKILFDGKEYWKYFHGGSRSFNGKKDGFVMILLDFLKEIEKRSNWNKDELMESFEKIRKALVKIKASFGKIEKVFSINLTKYHLIIHETLRKLPQKHLKKAQLDNLSKNLILEESKIEDLTNSDKICQVFLEKILEFAGKKSISLGEISGLYGFETIIVTKEEFIDKTREILKGFGDEFNLPKEEINIFVENFMLFKKNSRQEMNFKRFMNKLEKLMEKKRAIYQREGLKQEKQTMLKLEDQELSLQKKASLQNFIKWYQNDCIQKNKDSELNSLVKRFIEEIEREKSENHKLLMVRLLEIFNAYGDSSHLLRILELFTEEIVRKKEEEILRNCFWGTGVIKRLLMVLRNGEVLEFVDRALNILLECLIMEGKNVGIRFGFGIDKNVNFLSFFNFNFYIPFI